MKEARGICLAYVGGDRPALPAPGAQSFQQPTQHAVTTWPSATPPTGSNLFAATPPVKASSVRAITETELLNAVRREQSVQFVFRQEPKRSAALANLVGGEYRCFSQGQNRVVAIQVTFRSGVLGVLSAQQMGAERIIVMSRPEKRQQLARECGATCPY